jgi:hypothetical protein
MACVCGRPISGFAGSNPSRGMDICVFNRCVSMRRDDYLYRGVLPFVVCLIVIVEPGKLAGGLALGAVLT